MRRAMCTHGGLVRGLRGARRMRLQTLLRQAKMTCLHTKQGPQQVRRVAPSGRRLRH